MPDDAPVIESQPSAGETPAATAEPAVQAPASSTPTTPPFDFDTAFGPKAETGGRSATDTDSPTTGVPAQAATAEGGADGDDDDEAENGATAAVTAEQQGDTPQPEKLSRTAKLHEEYKAQIADLESKHSTAVTDLTTQVQALRAQLDQATGTVSETERQRQAEQAAFLEVYGDEAEYERRTRIANRMFDPNYTGPQLSDAEALELSRWTFSREHAAPLKERYLAEARAVIERGNADAQAHVANAQQQFKDYIVAETVPRAAQYGLDPEIVRTGQYGALLDHVADVTTKRLTERHTAELQTRDATIKERDDKISQLEAELREYDTSDLANRTPPLPGGNSADMRVTTRRVFDPKLSPHENFEAAFGPQSNGVLR